MRIVVGISGASGSVYGYTLLEKLRQNPEIEIHLVMTRSAERAAHLEMHKTAADFKALAQFNYPLDDIGARLDTTVTVHDADRVHIAAHELWHEALAGAPGLESTRSLSRNGFSQITAIFSEATEAPVSCAISL